MVLVATKSQDPLSKPVPDRSKSIEFDLMALLQVSVLGFAWTLRKLHFKGS